MYCFEHLSKPFCPCLIVMDNTSYHSRRYEEVPVKSWTKKRLIEWLDRKGIAYPPKASKLEALNLTPHYVVDEMAPGGMSCRVTLSLPM